MNDSHEQTPFDLEQVELKTDVQIHRGDEPRPNRSHPPSKAWPVVLMLGFIAMAGCGAAVFYFMRYQTVREDYFQLQKEIDTASQNLSTTSGSLEETREALTKSQTAIQRMRNELDQRQKEIQTLKAAATKSKSENTQQKKRLDAAQKSVKDHTTKLTAAEKKAQQLTAERNQLKDSMKAQETRDAERIADLNLALETGQAQATNQAQTYRKDLQKIQNEKNSLETDIRRLRDQAQSESQAGMEIIRERGQLKSENERLKLDLTNKEKALTRANQKIGRLENVQVGDLQAYSDEITAAEVIFREPLPEGVRLPRNLSQVVIMALINETGGVEKAFLLPDQDIDGMLARDIISTAYQWKFRPAKQGTTRVKVWQPILFR